MQYLIVHLHDYAIRQAAYVTGAAHARFVTRPHCLLLKTSRREKAALPELSGYHDM